MLLKLASRALALLVLISFSGIVQTAIAQDDYANRIYHSVFVPDSPIETGQNVEIKFENYYPLTLLLGDLDGRRYPVDFTAQSSSLRFRTTITADRIFLYGEFAGAGGLAPDFTITADGKYISGHWESGEDLISGDLLSVSDSLLIGTVAAADTHIVEFKTTVDPLSDSGIVWITLPQGFSYGAITDTAYIDDDPTNDGNEPVIRSVTTNGQTIRFQLSQGAQQATPGSIISIRFAAVNNNTIAGNYTAIVFTTDSVGVVDNGPGVSSPFTLSPELIDHINIEPGADLTIPSDSIVNFDVRGYDVYDNEISGISFTYALTVDSCGEISENDFRALKVGDCYLTASYGGVMDSSGLLQVIPGPLHYFTISGYPPQTTAGNRFIAPVVVTAYDLHDNIKTNYTGDVWFTSTDPSASLPYTLGAPYTFVVGDNGTHSFPGLGFILRTSGPRTITITDGTFSTQSNSITVNPALIISFTLSAGLSQIAGESFQLQASSAIDSLGNFASGEIIIADSVGGGDSPDGIPPSFNRIIVTGGSGSSFQTLTNAVPTVLKGTVSGSFAVAATGTITVVPGNLGRFNIDGYPDSTTAGIVFPDPGITVSVFDLYGNLKTNYTDSVYFESSDNLASLPYTQSSKYRFQVSDSGVHLFPGGGFTLYRAGYQTVSVTNGTLADSSSSIDVLPGIIDSFNMTAPGTVTAGVPFSVNVSACLDAWLNPADGVVIVSDSVGGGDSPDGISPSFNNITVTNGTGSALQTLTNAVPTVLKGTVSGSPALDATGTITVNPGNLGRFNIDGYPNSITAGIAFPDPGITVSVFDLFGNIKTNYTDSVYFESSDVLASLPYTQSSKYGFQVSDSGVHLFPGGGFTLYRAGYQTVSITNGTLADSSSSIDVLPGIIDSFNMTAPGTVTAGVPFSLNVSACLDAWLNPANGIVIVSDSVGGGNSPDGIPPSFNNISVTNGSGSALQTLTNAVPTVLKGTVSGSPALDATGIITVNPGNLGRFNIDGYPNSATAGIVFPDPGITVSVFDLFGNIKTNYTDSVYFESSDAQASLPYTQSSKYGFQISDSGVHLFPGGGFTLYTSGYHTVSVTDGIFSDSSSSIDVLPGAINSFIIFAPDTVTAGIPFPVGVSDCRDQWLNLTNGTVIVSDSVGGGNSPNGTNPIYNSIRVTSGSGLANQTLVNAVTTVLKGVAGTVVAATLNIYVKPGSIHDFALNVSSPQTSGVPFSGTSDLTAYDFFGNIKNNYDAAADTVVISSSGNGVMTNNIMNQTGDFTNGVIDLVSFGTTFTGRGGDMVFTALSQSGSQGVSGQVDMQAIHCSAMVIDQGILSWGDTATGVISVINDGGVAVDITDFDVLTESGQVLNPWNTNPPLPSSVGPGIHANFDILVPINSMLPVGTYPLTAVARGMFGASTVVDTLAGYPDTIQVQQASQISYVAGSLNRDTLSIGDTYSLAFRLANTGGAGLGLIDSSHIFFTDGTRQFRANIIGGIYLPPNSPAGTELRCDSTIVDQNFTPGNYSAKVRYYGQENGHFVADSVDVTETITLQIASSLSYIGGSLNVDTLVAGQTTALSVRLTNSGNADFVVDHDFSKIYFSDSQREYVAFSDTNSAIRVDRIVPGDTTFHFTAVQLSGEFSPGNYTPSMLIRGTENGHSRTANLTTNPNAIAVISRGKLRIDSTFVMAQNAPLVNIVQPCSVHVAVLNLGDEAVDSAYIHLSSDGSSAFADSAYLGIIPAHGIITFDYAVVAGSSPDSGEVFVSSISGGIGVISGITPQILAPLDNAAILIIETPANLSLSSIDVLSPPGAQDDTVSIGQQVTIGASVSNLGQAGFTGLRRLAIDPGTSGFVVADSLNRDYQLGQTVSWVLTAPSNPVNSAILTIRFADYPTDINDGSSAVGPDSVSTIEFAVDTQPSISQHPVIIAPLGARDSVLSNGQMFRVIDTLFAAGEYRDLSVSIELPFGFTTDDSIVKYPAGNTVAWNVRAPVEIVLDSIGFVSQLFDVNSGDVHSAGPDYLQLSTVEMARVSVAVSIVGPNAALDGIIEPGSYLEYQAVVSNVGQADCGSGILILQIGHPDLVSRESLRRTFTIGQPVVWTIDAPAFELPSAVAISAVLDSIPDDENTGQAAFVNNSSASLQVSVREFLPRLDFGINSVHTGSVVRGEVVDYLHFDLINNDRGGSFPIGITGITVMSRANYPTNGSTAAPVNSSFIILDDTAQVATGTNTAEGIVFDFADTVVVMPGESLPFTLRLTISSISTATDFSLWIEDQDIRGVILDDNFVVGEIVARTVSGELIWEGSPIAILEQSFAGSVTSYPNPFNPRQTPARIGYYLQNNSQMRVRIFTLLGDLVWSVDIPASDPLGRAGLHTGDSALLWYGKNDAGHEVHSGVYICMIENVSTGEEEQFKIAVLK